MIMIHYIQPIDFERENEVVEVNKLDPVAEATKLKEEFEELLVTILQSLGGVDLDNLKLRISVFFSTEVQITPEVKEILDQLQLVSSPKCVLNFLVTRCFVGYFNYKLLTPFQKALKGKPVEAKIQLYEKVHDEFLRKFSFSAIIEMFNKHPNLAPPSVVGLPCVTFKLNSPWEEKCAYEWTLYLEKKFTWPSHLITVSMKRGCIVLIYAVLPFFICSIVKDLEDPLLLKQLEIEGISVELSSDLLKLGKEEYECINTKKWKEQEIVPKSILGVRDIYIYIYIYIYIIIIIYIYIYIYIYTIIIYIYTIP